MRKIYRHLDHLDESLFAQQQQRPVGTDAAVGAVSRLISWPPQCELRSTAARPVQRPGDEGSPSVALLGSAVLPPQAPFQKQLVLRVCRLVRVHCQILSNWPDPSCEPTITDRFPVLQVADIGVSV